MIDIDKPIVEELNSFIEENGIEGTTTNSYLFIMFFLQRSQLVSNIIRLITCNENSFFIKSIKYNLINKKDFSDIKKSIEEFKKFYSKSDLLSEILNFIKGSISIKEPINFSEILEDELKKGKSKYGQTIKIKNLILNFKSIKDTLKKIDESSIISEEEIAEYINNGEIQNNAITMNNIKIEKELKKIEKEWKIFQKEKKNSNYPLFLFVRKWIKF